MLLGEQRQPIEDNHLRPRLSKDDIRQITYTVGRYPVHLRKILMLPLKIVLRRTSVPVFREIYVDTLNYVDRFISSHGYAAQCASNVDKLRYIKSQGVPLDDENCHMSSMYCGETAYIEFCAAVY